jgi:thiamine pyrophosphokinase
MSSAMRLLKKFPESPRASDVIGFFLNGGREGCETPDTLRRLSEKVNLCTHLILVDGGANHFLRLSNKCQENVTPLIVSPSYLIGDLDSVEESTVETLYSRFPELKTERFDRDKDFTDLEGALQMAKLDQVAEAVLFCALGGRRDHELTIIKYMHTKQIRDKVSIFHPTDGSLQVISPARPVELQQDERVQFFPLFNPRVPVNISGNRYVVDRGKMLCLISREEGSDLEVKLNDMISLIQNPYPHILRTDAGEELFVVSSGQKVRFSAQIAQTISLIHIGGPAKNVLTEGLHWEIDLEKFGKKICGVSNIAVAEEVSIFVGEGSLLCIKNGFIDEDMYKLVKK